MLSTRKTSAVAARIVRVANWGAGASCHSKVSPALVSRNEMVVVAASPLSTSPR
jgi:hypothetical protein